MFRIRTDSEIMNTNLVGFLDGGSAQFIELFSYI
jgi:hypothetical protein